MPMRGKKNNEEEIVKRASYPTFSIATSYCLCPSWGSRRGGIAMYCSCTFPLGRLNGTPSLPTPVVDNPSVYCLSIVCVHGEKHGNDRRNALPPAAPISLPPARRVHYTTGQLYVFDACKVMPCNLLSLVSVPDHLEII